MKIFGIGLSRTGTSSLSEALTILGYRSKHFPTIGQHQSGPDKGRVGILRGDIDRFDALSDTPVTANYKALDNEFTDAKFILTTRDITQWLNSCQNFPRFAKGFQIHPAIKELRKTLYGTDYFDCDKFRQAYIDHERDVDQHFASKPDKLLKMDICNGQGWEALCPFLDKPAPAEPFPYLNSRNLP